jgi:peptidoglycan/LPS O-acetylase OafA/YrhL
VEEHFYLVWPIVVLLLPRSKLIAIGLFSIACGIVTRTD